MRNTPLFRKPIYLTALLSLLVSCTFASIAGKYADWYILDEIDEHYDLSQGQNDYLEPKVKGLLSWAKREALTSIDRDLGDLRNRVSQGLKPADVTWLQERASSYQELLGQQIQKDAVWLLTNLSPSQVKHIEEEIKERRSKWQERLSAGPKEFTEKSFERYEERLEDWLGTVTAAQRQILQEQFGEIATRANAAAHYQGRMQLQDRYLAVVASSDRKVARAFLQSWFQDPASLRSKEARIIYDKRLQAFWQSLIRFDQSATPKQRQHLLRKIDKYRQDLKEFQSS